MALSDTSIQTEGRVVTASDHELLGTQLVASVLEAQQSAKALVQESAAFEGLVKAMNRQQKAHRDEWRTVSCMV